MPCGGGPHVAQAGLSLLGGDGNALELLPPAFQGAAVTGFCPPRPGSVSEGFCLGFESGSPWAVLLPWPPKRTAPVAMLQLVSKEISPPLLFNFFFYFHFMCLGVLLVCMYVCVGVRSPGNGVIAAMGCWELNPGPLKGSQCF